MELYIDSSVLITLMLEQDRAERFQRIISHGRRVVSSALLEAEVMATLAREKRPLEFAIGFLAGISLIFPDRSLYNQYIDILNTGYLRGADAFHVATALYIDPQRTELTFVTGDEKQAEVARKLGFIVPK